MILSQRVALIAVCLIITLMIADLVLYVRTFHIWNCAPALLTSMNSILSALSWVLPATCTVAAIIIGIVTHRFRWSLKHSPSWFQTLSAVIFVVTMILIITTLMRQKRADVRVDGHTIEVSLEGDWQRVSLPVFEQTVRQNTRVHLAFILFGLLLWMDYIGCLSAYCQKQPLVVGNRQRDLQ
jgi:hypothetical protein